MDMYRAAIADDEIGIREGLQELVAWEKLGFTLEDAFDDGDELLSLLKKTPLDLIVTDIRMNRCSGLDVSKYIQEHGLHTRVILISGYKEADLAMSAIKYGVKDYILKPVDLDELTACIEKIKKELDKDAAVSFQKTELNRTQNNMQDLMKLFLNEILQGGLQNSQLIQRIFQLLYPALSYEQTPCFSFHLRIRQPKNFTHSSQKLSRSSLPSYINRFSQEASSLVEIKIAEEASESMVLFGLLRGRIYSSPQGIIQQEINLLCEKIKNSFGILAQSENLLVFSNIPVMLEYIASCSRMNRITTQADAAESQNHSTSSDSQEAYSPENMDFARLTQEYVSAHMGEDISLEDVSEYFYLSPSYFSRMFKAQTGQNFVRFVIDCKMNYAAQLLTHTDLKIYDVCERTGYKSLRHFNKLFKEYTGAAPSVYRQRMHMGGHRHES